MAGCLVLPPFLGLMLPMFPGLLLLARGLPALVLGTLLPPERVDGIDTPVDLDVFAGTPDELRRRYGR